MKKGRNISLWLFAIALIGIAAGIYGWSIYHESRPKLDDVRADFQITANELNQAFSSNEQEANQKYLDKILQVKGVVSNIQRNGPKVIVELLGPADAMGGVNCEMRTDENLPLKGDPVLVKGRCTGYLMDVNIVDAVILK